MKKKIIYAVCFFIIVLVAPACEKTCKTCKKVYYDESDVYIREDGEAEYCGVELISIDGKVMTITGIGTAKWECR